jgi:hypothetical protein
MTGQKVSRNGKTHTQRKTQPTPKTFKKHIKVVTATIIPVGNIRSGDGFDRCLSCLYAFILMGVWRETRDEHNILRR